ncbi:acyltransferase [Spirosoma radiotolerans]|uniref:Acetyltransferase n=1 Tax=Spirosoma radiotolerans TaxID=1379870 RepID=A0A0E3ZX74_9BACT|nr:acyltransferase [Spirosoma radiotolerans]AKD56049.1 acetyltransferase [Spirosoma radiotolerans]
MKLIQYIVNKKNPSFIFDENVNSVTFINLLFKYSLDFLRGFLYYILHFKKPKIVFIGRNVSFFNSQNIQLGSWSTIGTGVYLSGLGKGKIIIGRSSGIGSYSQIIISTSFNNIGEHITIGNNVGIGQFSSLGGSGGLEIHDNCIIGQYFSCHPENHNYSNINLLIKDQGTTRSKIVIGQNCWIGAKVTILAGVYVGNNCVIAAGAVVTKSIPDNAVVAGVPAKIIKIRT